MSAFEAGVITRNSDRIVRRLWTEEEDDSFEELNQTKERRTLASMQRQMDEWKFTVDQNSNTLRVLNRVMGPADNAGSPLPGEGNKSWFSNAIKVLRAFNEQLPIRHGGRGGARIVQFIGFQNLELRPDRYNDALTAAGEDQLPFGGEDRTGRGFDSAR